MTNKMKRIAGWLTTDLVAFTPVNFFFTLSIIDNVYANRFATAAAVFAVDFVVSVILRVIAEG